MRPARILTLALLIAPLSLVARTMPWKDTSIEQHSKKWLEQMNPGVKIPIPSCAGPQDGAFWCSTPVKIDGQDINKLLQCRWEKEGVAAACVEYDPATSKPKVTEDDILGFGLKVGASLEKTREETQATCGSPEGGMVVCTTGAPPAPYSLCSDYTLIFGDVKGLAKVGCTGTVPLSEQAFKETANRLSQRYGQPPRVSASTIKQSGFWGGVPGRTIGIEVVGAANGSGKLTIQIEAQPLFSEISKNRKAADANAF